MKYIIIIFFTIYSNCLVGQALLYGKYIDTTLDANVTYDTVLVQKLEGHLDSIKINKVYYAEWGDSLNYEKYLAFTDSIGKVVVFQKSSNDSLEKLTFHYIFEGVCDYPETSEITKILTLDFNNDGLLELMFIENGGEKRWSEEHKSAYTGECCIYIVFKQYGKDIRVFEYGTFETDHDLCQFKEWKNVVIIEKWKEE